MKKFIPRDATLAITYKCNSRCEMCSIWQIPNPVSLALICFDNLSPDLKYINISGGEPFLSPNLPEIIARIKKACPRAQLIISSNGYATDLISQTMVKILAIDPNIGIRISLDGLKETHNRIRGYADFFARAMNTVDRLKEMAVKNLGFSFTIMDSNIDDLIKIYDLSRQKDIQLALALVQNSDIYFHKSDNRLSSVARIESALDYIIKKELAGWNIKHWLRAYYDYGLRYNLTTGRRLLPSGAAFDSLFVDPSGDVYPSNLIALKMGNLKEKTLDEIWSGDLAAAVREKINKQEISESWIICTIRGEIKRHLLKVGWWVLKNKFIVR